MIFLRELSGEEICRELFQDFVRRQIVTDCRRKRAGQWVIERDSFIDDWSEDDYLTLVRCLKNTAATGGCVFGAFQDGRLKGFASVEAELFGGEERYLDLSSIHVSQDIRGQGVGTLLFNAVKEWAGRHGGKKLYISAHSAVETQAFYQAMGCVEAAVYQQKHVEAEPFDCQLECLL